jgi:hypothetical protein
LFLYSNIQTDNFITFSQLQQATKTIANIAKMDANIQNDTTQNTERTTGVSSPSLTINYSISVFSDKKFTEYVNTEMLERLIQSSNILRQDKWGDWDLYENELAQLKAYKKLIKYSKAEVVYKKLEHDYGRVFPNKSLSLGTLAREIRHTICKDYYADIDIVNCHCVILEQICKANNIQCKNLSLYNQQRDTILHDICNKYFVSRDDAKTLFIIHLYLGSFKSWADKLEIVDEKPTDFLMDFANELKAISVDIEKANPQLKKDVEKANKKEDRAKKQKFWRSTIMSLFLQDWERRILEEVYNYLCHHKYIIDNDCVLCFDGIMIHNSRYNEELLSALSKHIKERIGFDIQFSKKEMTNDIIKALEYNELNIIDKQEEKHIEKYKKHKKEFEDAGGCKINNPLSFYCGKSIGSVDRKGLIDLYEDHIFRTDKKNFIKMWLEDPDKKVYDHIDFIPDPNYDNPNILNTFTGFDIEKYQGIFDSNDGSQETQIKRCDECRVLFDYLFTISNCNPEHYKFLMYWIAWIFQKPYAKTGVCVVMQSVLSHGVGKSTFFLLLSSILGKKYTNCTEQIGEVLNANGDKFAAGRQDKLLVAINEIDFKNAATYSSALKDAITEGSYDIQQKFKSTIKYSSYDNWLIFSNKDLPILKEKGDRRYYNIHISKSPYKLTGIEEQDKEIKINFFTPIYDIIGNNIKNTPPNYEILRTFYDYFKHYDISDVKNLQAFVNGKDDNLISRDPIDLFLEDYLINIIDGVEELSIDNTALFKKFNKFVSDGKFVNYNIDIARFGKFINKYCTENNDEPDCEGHFITKKRHNKGTNVSFSLVQMAKYYNIEIS